MKILLVEDDESIAKVLEEILRGCQYIVDHAAEGQLGWEFIETYDYDLIVLDVVLPKLDGIEFCKRLRAIGNQTPVMLLTAQNSHNKKVIGLDAGADDYVVKPFEISELLARIRVLLRRRNSLDSPILSWEKLSLNSTTHAVTYDGKNLNLTPKEYRLLELFLRNGERVLTRENILESLWDVEEAPSENTIAVHIKDLRRKLKQAGAKVKAIETVYGVGYRLKPLTSTSSNHKSAVKTLANTKTPDMEAELRQKTKSALAEIWQKSEYFHARGLEILERANHEWQNNSLEGKLLQQAQQAAHKLAGGLGVFGFTRGSRLALEMEELLSAEANQDRAQQFSQLLSALKNSLKTNNQLQSDNSQEIFSLAEPTITNHFCQKRPWIVAIDDNPQFAKKIIAAMTAIGMTYKLVTNSQAFVRTIEANNFNNLQVIIWTFSLAQCQTETLARFVRIFSDEFPLPVILFTDSQNQTDLLKTTHLGSPILFQQPTSDRQAIARIVNALQLTGDQVTKILLVDDDLQVLAAVNNLLNPLNVDLTVLNNPQDFWQTIEALEPDLLILDVSMPDLTGIELCQLARNDPRWRELPILFLTIHSDSQTIDQILSAGANDRVSKTSAHIELVPKIFNHLARRQLANQL